jgi:hypothetical protein
MILSFCLEIWQICCNQISLNKIHFMNRLKSNLSGEKFGENSPNEKSPIGEQ